MTPSRFVCFLVYRILPRERELQFLVIDYRSTDPRTGQLSGKQVKFPGGTNRGHPEETSGTTGIRELMEETGLRAQAREQIWKRIVSQDHVQCAFMSNIDDCLGVLRLEPFVDDDGDQLAPPRWVDSQTLGRELFDSHQGPFLAALARLRERGIY